MVLASSALFPGASNARTPMCASAARSVSTWSMETANVAHQQSAMALSASPAFSYLAGDA